MKVSCSLFSYLPRRGGRPCGARWGGRGRLPRGAVCPALSPAPRLHCICLSPHSICPATHHICPRVHTCLSLSQIMPRRERGPPCSNPTCSDDQNASGQWAYLPPSFAEEHSLDKDACHCHKRPCRRWCGKLGTQLPPGRTAAGAPAKRVRAGDAAIGVALNAADELPRPPILVSIDEIWAVRCCPPSLPPSLVQHRSRV